MTTLTPENVQWLLQELDAACEEIRPTNQPGLKWPRLYCDSTKTEVALSIAVALRYQIKGGEG